MKLDKGGFGKYPFLRDVWDATIAAGLDPDVEIEPCSPPSPVANSITLDNHAFGIDQDFFTDVDLLIAMVLPEQHVQICYTVSTGARMQTTALSYETKAAHEFMKYTIVDEMKAGVVPHVDKGNGYLKVRPSDFCKFALKYGISEKTLKTIEPLRPPKASPEAVIPKVELEACGFDVFLCHNSQDKALVKQIGEQLKTHNIRSWLDEWNLRPGFPWQNALERQIESIKSVAVFVGPAGIGPWQDNELAAFMRQFVKRQCPVIPVILRGCIEEPTLPVFLQSFTWVDFRKEAPDPIQQLIWGITGKQNILHH